MNIEKVEEIKELLRCMNGEKACTDCYINEVAHEQETCCINVVADMTLDLINELESENETLRNAKVVYETVDYCAEDLKKAQERIAELENQMCRNEDLHNATEKLNDTIILKQFAERLKEHPIMGIYSLHNACERIPKAIDETLKEFINE